MKWKKYSVYFSFLLSTCLLLHPFNVYAKEKNDSIKKEKVFITKTANEKQYEKQFEETIQQGKKTYKLSNVQYETLKVNLLTKIPKVVDSEVIPIGTEHLPEAEIIEAGITYQLVKTETEEKVISEAQTQAVNGYTDYDTPVTAENVPQSKTIMATNAITGENQEVDCSLTGVSPNGTNTVTKQMSITFYDYDSLYYQLGNELVERNDDAPPLKGHETALLQMAGAEPASTITGIAWSGGAYTAPDGTVCRNALANVEQVVNLYRANYSGGIEVAEVKGTIYKSTYEGLNPKGDKEYEVKATATYVEQENRLPVYIAIGAGILVAIGTIIVILLLLAKKKKEQEKIVSNEL